MRLIDADALMRHIKSVVAEFLNVGNHSGLFLKHDSCNPAEFTRGYESGAMEIASIVSGCVTVDAVEVVRCKDCKRCFEKRTKRYNNLMRFCMRLDGNEFQVNANDYCSYGKRKDDEW